MSEDAHPANVLLARATEDELMARSLLPVEGVTDAGIGFHTQQAVEKSLKAILAKREIEFPYVHDIDGLLELPRKTALRHRMIYPAPITSRRLP